MLKRIFTCTLFLFASGCATMIYPQPQPQQPVAVYLADYGIHSSVILPTPNGRYVEYAFGDWYYAALNHCWPNDAVGALLVSFQSTLGRRYFDLPPGQTVPLATHPSPNRVQVIYGSREAVNRVVAELDARYRADGSHVVHNPDNNMDYVPDSQHSWFLNNCNHLTAHCLREMGCDVRGLVMLSTFDVAPVQRDVVADSASVASHRKGQMPSAKAD